MCCRCHPPSFLRGGVIHTTGSWSRGFMCSRLSGISMRVLGQDHLSTSATGPGPRSGAMFVLDRTIYRRRRPDLGQGRVHYSKIGYLVGISAQACVGSCCLLNGLTEPMNHVCFSVSSEPCRV